MNQNRTNTIRVLCLLLAAPIATATACGADGSAGGASSPWPGTDTGGWGAVDTWSPGGWPDAAAAADVGPPPPPPPPPEEERDFDLRTPEAGGSLLYIPSAALDALVVVDATDLRVSLVEVGSRPILVRALPGDQGAIVLNAGTSDVTIVRPEADRKSFTTRTLDVPPHHNRLELSPDGTWAFAWYARSGDPTEPIGSLQDVSAIRTIPGSERVFNLAVGLRPERAFFTKDGGTAVFLCEDGLSGLRLETLDADTFLPPVPLHDDLSVQPSDREVVVTPDAHYAIARDLDRQELTLVDLVGDERHVLALPDYPSDLDLTPDGKRVVVPFKALQSVAVLAVPEAFLVALPEGATSGLDGNPHASLAATGHPFGTAELAADGHQALLFTTQPGTLAIGHLDLSFGTVQVRPLAKEVTRAAISPDGATAVLFDRKSSGLHAPEATSEAYTLLDLATGYAKLVLTANAPTEVVFAGDGAELFILLPAAYGSGHAVDRVRDFAVTQIATPEAPIFVGLLPLAHRAAVMLDDPTGWLTLIDLSPSPSPSAGPGAGVDQVNSFELNSFIE